MHLELDRMAAAVLPNLITELDAAVKAGSPERGDRILRQVTSLFLSNVDRLGEAQIGVPDDVLVRLSSGRKQNF